MVDVYSEKSGSIGNNTNIGALDLDGRLCGGELA